MLYKIHYYNCHTIVQNWPAPGKGERLPSLFQGACYNLLKPIGSFSSVDSSSIKKLHH